MPDPDPLDGFTFIDDDGFQTAWVFPDPGLSPEQQLEYVDSCRLAHDLLKATAMAEPGIIITNRERISDTTEALHMSDESILFGCTWPGCGFTSPNRDSIPTHYKTHVGQAAQRRRSQRRPRSAEVTNELLEAALATLDMAQMLIDRVDAFDAQYTNLVRQLEEAKIEIEELRQGDDELRRKADAYDRIQEAIRNASS